MTPRQALYILGGLILAAGLIYLAWAFDPFKRKANAEAKATVATQQTKVAEATVQAQDRVIRVETTIRQMAQEGQNHVQEAQGADGPLDPSLAAAIRLNVDRLRVHTASSPDQPATEP